MGEGSTRQTEVEQSIRDTIAREKITSLDELVSRSATSYLNRLDEEDRLFVVGDALSRDPQRVSAPKPHRPPEMDLFIDEQRHDPARITEFNGRPLYSTPGVSAKGDPVMYSFTSIAGLQRHLLTSRLPDIGTTNPDSLSPMARYAEHIDQQGDWLWNNPGRAWRDLTRVSRGFFGLGSWNDLISSVDWCRWDISLYEHINYGGSQLYLRAGRTYNNLVAFGWNDRASATVNWGTRF